MNNVQQYLLDQQVSYILHEHPPVYTCEEAQKYCSGIPGLSCKNLFLRNKKAQRYFLLVLAYHRRADLKKISDIIIVTSKYKVDDDIETYCKNKKIKIFRGSLNNVASRFFEVSKIW